MKTVKMTLFWLTLLLFPQGYSLVPVVTVQLGKPVIFTCAFTKEFQSMDWIYWYKQNAGDNLKLISMARENTNPIYGQGFSSTNFNTTLNDKMSNLTILKTATEDEGMYHCGHISWFQSMWNGTYLSIKGKSARTASYTVVQQSTSDPARSTDSETLQCSFLSKSENPTCSGEPSVFWFRSRSDESLPDLIYMDGKISENCEEGSDSPKRCVYNFSKNISSSDAGTYYCAVATCGEILFGNGANLDIHESSIGSPKASIVNYSLSAALAMSLICMALLICSINRMKCEHHQASGEVEENCGQKKEDIRMYTAVIFTMMKTRNIETKKTAERQMTFAAVKAFGL